MKLVIQRVKQAQVEVDQKIVGKIKEGFLVLLGIEERDTKEDVNILVKKVTQLRIFEDENEKMNLSLKDVQGELLIISQFTLYANCKNGNRPSFTEAAKPDVAIPLYEYFIQQCKEQVSNVQTGIFGAHMEVSLLNNGPVTILMESKNGKLQ